MDQSATWLRGKLGRPTRDAPFEGEPLGPLLSDFRKEYFGPGRRIINPLNRGWLSDPLPPLSRIVRVFTEAVLRRAS